MSGHVRLACARLGCPATHSVLFLVTVNGRTDAYCRRHFQAQETMPPSAAIQLLREDEIPARASSVEAAPVRGHEAVTR